MYKLCAFYLQLLRGTCRTLISVVTRPNRCRLLRRHRRRHPWGHRRRRRRPRRRFGHCGRKPFRLTGLGPNVTDPLCGRRRRRCCGQRRTTPFARPDHWPSSRCSSAPTANWTHSAWPGRWSVRRAVLGRPAAMATPIWLGCWPVSCWLRAVLDCCWGCADHQSWSRAWRHRRRSPSPKANCTVRSDGSWGRLVARRESDRSSGRTAPDGVGRPERVGR